MPMPSVYSTQARVFFDRYEALEASEIKALLETADMAARQLQSRRW